MIIYSVNQVVNEKIGMLLNASGVYKRPVTELSTDFM
jgi:hypothetical protein